MFDFALRLLCYRLEQTDDGRHDGGRKAKADNPMLNDKLSSMIKKIEQLRAIAKSTHSTHESATCLAKAQQLMTDYQLSEAQIESETGKVNDPIDLGTSTILYQSKRVTTWKQHLVCCLPELLGCYVINVEVRGEESHHKESRFRVVGKVSAVELCKYMFAFIVDEIERLADHNIPSRGKRGRNPAKESFCLGAVHGFIAKMKKERDDSMNQANSAAMVLVSQQVKEAEKAFASTSDAPIVTSSLKTSVRGGENYQNGVEKGRNISVNAGLNSGSAPKKPNQLY